MQVSGKTAKQDAEAAAKAKKEAEAAEAKAKKEAEAAEAKAKAEAVAAQAKRDAEAAAMKARETEARYPGWRVVKDGVRMRSEADLGSALIDGVVLPVGFVAEQIAAAQHVDGVERVKIRDRSGKEGWVTPDARPKGGHVWLEVARSG